MSKSGMSIPVQAELVRPAVALSPDHARDLVPLGSGGTLTETENPGYPADGRSSVGIVARFMNPSGSRGERIPAPPTKRHLNPVDHQRPDVAGRRLQG
jgi:hypothetical protein